MKLFIDTAIYDEIQEINQWGVLDGVTTNPSLVKKSKENFEDLIKKIAQEVQGPVSAEVPSGSCEDMVKEGRRLSQLSDHVVIKIPMTEEGLKATAILTRENIPVNVTLIFSPSQALLAARAGATYVSPFIGRLDDISTNGMDLIASISKIFKLHGIGAEIIAASIRHPMHVVEAALNGADIATVPYKVFKQMLNHPLTDQGLESFNKDWNMYLKGE